MINETPTEQSESEAFSTWLTMKGLRHHHGNDNMYTKSWGQKRKMKSAGFSKGYPDFTIVVQHRGLVFVEMKRVKGGVTSQYQKDWIDALNGLGGVEARVCKGSEDAINFISEIIG